MSYKFAYSLVWLCRLFTAKNSFRYYKLTYMMEDIVDEAYYACISEQMNRNWNLNNE